MKKVNKKKRVILFLAKEGRSSSSQIANYIQSDIWAAKKYLSDLLREGLIIKEVESRATYWTLK